MTIAKIRHNEWVRLPPSFHTHTHTHTHTHARMHAHTHTRTHINTQRLGCHWGRGVVISDYSDYRGTSTFQVEVSK